MGWLRYGLYLGCMENREACGLLWSEKRSDDRFECRLSPLYPTTCPRGDHSRTATSTLLMQGSTRPQQLLPGRGRQGRRRRLGTILLKSFQKPRFAPIASTRCELALALVQFWSDRPAGDRGWLERCDWSILGLYDSHLCGGRRAQL